MRRHKWDLRYIEEGVIQYVLIILCLLVHNTWFYSLHDMLYRAFVIGVSCVFLIIRKKILPRKLIALLMILIGALFVMETVFSGFSQYKACLYMCMFICEPILITLVCYNYNPQMYATRFVRSVSFVAAVSLVFFAFANINLSGFINSGMVEKVEGMKISFTDYYCNPFYAMRYREPNKNLGPFCEPGLYQIVLIAAIYLLIFYQQRVYVKHRFCLLFLLAVTLITAKSATGYISLTIVAGGVIVAERKKINKTVRRIIAIGFLAILAGAVYDICVNGESGLVYTYLVEKLFEIGSAEETTGSVRLTTITVCLKLILHNPMGYGYTYVARLFAENYEKAVAATLLKTTAMAGLLPVLLLLIYFFDLARKKRVSNIQFGVLVLLYFNTALAQSREFYPALLALFLLDRSGRREKSLYEVYYDKCLKR